MAPAPRLTPAGVVALFEQATTLEFGLRFEIDAAIHSRAQTMIQVAMKPYPALREKIVVCAFPKDNELWLVKKTVSIEI